MNIRQSLVLGILTVASLVALGVALFVAINWADRPASAAAQQLEAVLRVQPVVAPASNAYMQMLAIDIPLGRDVVATEIARAAAMNKTVAQDAFFDKSFDDGLAPIPIEPAAVYVPLYQACKELDRSCETVLVADTGQADAWIASQDWLVKRYATMLDSAGWREPAGDNAKLPSFSAAMHGQRLHLLGAWRSARLGDQRAVAAMLAADLAFWRKVQVSSSTLVVKLMATVAIRRHFRWSGMVLRRLPPGAQIHAIPAQWRTPFSAAERSMLLAMAGEYAFVKRNLALLAYDPDYETWWAGMAIKFGLQKQDALNRHADYRLALTKSLDVDYANLPQVAAKLATLRPLTDEQTFGSALYNPFGKFLLATTSGMADYGTLVADLEGVRRAALLAAELRSQGIGVNKMAQYVNAAALRDPYTGRPFEWDQTAFAIVANGLSSGPRGRVEIEP